MLHIFISRQGRLQVEPAIQAGLGACLGFQTGKVVVTNQQGKILFDSQSTPSTSSNPAADETGEAGDSAKVAESDPQESGEAIKSGQDGGKTAEESMPWPRRTPEAVGLQYPPTSPPTTAEDGQSTPKGPTTTRSADCSSLATSDSTKAACRIHPQIAAIEKAVHGLHGLVTDLWRCASKSTTQAPAAPASDGEKTT